MNEDMREVLQKSKTVDEALGETARRIQSTEAATEKTWCIFRLLERRDEDQNILGVVLLSDAETGTNP